MNNDLVNLGGEPIAQSDLRIPRAVSLAKYLSGHRNDYAHLNECRIEDKNDVVVFTVDVERHQETINDIRYQEVIAVKFAPEDVLMPEIYALRKTFPRVPHLYLRHQEFPRSLCLYEQPFDELRDILTSHMLVEQIRTWLQKTAEGTLHDPEQSLEPLLPGSNEYLLVPTSCADIVDNVLRLSCVQSAMAKNFYQFTQDGREFLIFMLDCPPQEHGFIYSIPNNLFDLHNMVQSAGVDLREAIKAKIFDTDQDKNLPMGLIILFPKQRTRETPPETTDIYAFFTKTSVYDVGVSLGICEKRGQSYGMIMGDNDSGKNGTDVDVYLFTPIPDLGREMAASLNNRRSANMSKIAAIGVGAIGSQIIENLARAGIGIWTIIDKDIMFPHNTTRHALCRSDVGKSKSEAMKSLVRDIMNDETSAQSFSLDIMSNQDELKQALDSCEIILDFSVSTTVARYLSTECSSSAKRVSFFMTPSGKASVLLAEDSDRTIPLHSLEMQYYRAILNNDELSSHLFDASNAFRYGRTCSDISTVLPQHLVALHAATGSYAIQDILDNTDAKIRIWQVDTDTFSMQTISITPMSTLEYQEDDWKVITDEGFIQKLRELRQLKLPSETGGVILGTFNMRKRIVYLADVLPSPPDSEEWPNAYIRGCVGLKEQVETASKKTANMLQYMGEWHSHPDNCPVAPSDDDKRFLQWLKENVGADQPAVLLIIGQEGRTWITVVANN